MCAHVDLKASVVVNGITAAIEGPVLGYSADVRVWCGACGSPFRWLGLTPGVSPARPMASLDRLELRAPCQPVTERLPAGEWAAPSPVWLDTEPV